MYRMIPGIAFSKSQPHFFALKYSATNFVSTDANKNLSKNKNSNITQNRNYYFRINLSQIVERRPIIDYYLS